jgi:FtsP/CotA-like multicopper oxidase with cupredoxin domain
VIDNDVTFLHHSSPGTLPKPRTTEEESESNVSLVTNYQLEQNYPNPFNPATIISFALPEAGEVQLSIFSENGQLVRRLGNRQMAAGRHSMLWDGRNQSGDPVAAGVYLYRLVVQGESGNAVFTKTRRMTVLK